MVGRIGRKNSIVQRKNVSDAGRQQRIPGEPRAAQAFVSRSLVIDFDRHLVLHYNEPVDLTPTEFKLLRVLVENAGRVLSQEYLLEQVWGAEYAGDEGYIRRYIWYLRQKIEEDPRNPQYIITERGFGYSFRKNQGLRFTQDGGGPA